MLAASGPKRACAASICDLRIAQSTPIILPWRFRASVIPEKSDLFETKRVFLVAREGPVRSS